MTPVYHLFTFMIFLISVTAFANAIVYQTDDNMKKIVLIFAGLLAVLGSIRMLSAVGLFEIEGTLLAIVYVFWVLAFGGLFSILGVPVVMRFLEIRHDNKA